MAVAGRVGLHGSLKVTKLLNNYLLDVSIFFSSFLSEIPTIGAVETTPSGLYLRTCVVEMHRI